MDAEIAKPSGWLGALGVGNHDSIATLAEAPALRMAGLTNDRLDDTSSDGPFAALRAPHEQAGHHQAIRIKIARDPRAHGGFTGISP